MLTHAWLLGFAFNTLSLSVLYYSRCVLPKVPLCFIECHLAILHPIPKLHKISRFGYHQFRSHLMCFLSLPIWHCTWHYILSVIYTASAQVYEVSRRKWLLNKHIILVIVLKTNGYYFPVLEIECDEFFSANNNLFLISFSFPSFFGGGGHYLCYLIHVDDIPVGPFISCCYCYTVKELTKRNQM